MGYQFNEVNDSSTTEGRNHWGFISFGERALKKTKKQIEPSEDQGFFFYWEAVNELME